MVAAVVASPQSSSTPLSPYPSPSSLRGFIRDAPPYSYSSTQTPPQVQTAGVGGGGGGGNGKISPAVLFIIVILAVIFFISGLLHLLVRILMKKQHGRGADMGESAPSPHRTGGARDAAMDRQLQQLFHLHDSGLDQAFIDALPVFAYRDIIGGSKEPFDCAVCLCEFDGEDRLRLLPVCGHAFHLQCIDTWLLSNSTCPLCRGTLFVPGMTIDNLLFEDFDERLEEEPLPEECEDGHQVSRHKPMDEEQTEKRVFPVRLGKFKNVGNQGAVGGMVGNGNEAGIVSREAGESSSSSLDARRCFSMGTYQYVLGASELRVALQTGHNRNGASSRFKGRVAGLSSVNADIMEGKRICARSKGESFSVSKIWQWSSVKGKLPPPPDTCSDTGSLPWMKRNAAGDKFNM